MEPAGPQPLFSYSVHDALRMLWKHCERTGVDMPAELKIAIQHALKFRGVICPTCGKGCRNMGGLRDHQQAKHPQPKEPPPPADPRGTSFKGGWAA